MATMNMHLTAVPLGVFMGQDISIMVFSWVWAHGITGVIGMAGVTVASAMLAEGAIGLVTDQMVDLLTDRMTGQITDLLTDQIADTITGLAAIIALTSSYLFKGARNKETAEPVGSAVFAACIFGLPQRMNLHPGGARSTG